MNRSVACKWTYTSQVELDRKKYNMYTIEHPIEHMIISL